MVSGSFECRARDVGFKARQVQRGRKALTHRPRDSTESYKVNPPNLKESLVGDPSNKVYNRLG